LDQEKSGNPVADVTSIFFFMFAIKWQPQMTKQNNFLPKKDAQPILVLVRHIKILELEG
jgi:hypothetical protein